MSTDNTIIERSLAQPRAFSEIFERHASGVHRYAARRAGQVVADDVTSETFLIAFERRARFDLSREDARPWLLGIATNLIHRHRIAEARTLRSIERFTAMPEGSNDLADRDAAMDAKAAIRALASALRKLPVRDRDALLLFAWADLSYEEIATALGIPIGTVRSRLNRARRVLRISPTSSKTEEVGNERHDLAPDTA